MFLYVLIRAFVIYKCFFNEFNFGLSFCLKVNNLPNESTHLTFSLINQLMNNLPTSITKIKMIKLNTNLIKKISFDRVMVDRNDKIVTA